MRKNKEVPRDFYANDAIWNAVYAKAVGELKDAMDFDLDPIAVRDGWVRISGRRR